jgi:capsular polysaccharide export protein
VYVVSSQIGFEALIWGRPVRTFGMPFYAGWRLTEDNARAPQGRSQTTLEALIHAALVEYPRYVDPETGERCEVERVIEHISLQRRMRSRFPENICAIGFSRWKRPLARAFMAGSNVTFVGHFGKVPSSAQAIAVWGSKQITSSTAAGRPLIRVEDGFLRSVGLGAEFARPLSWVLDDVGIYYDATAPSRIEDLLLQDRFETAQLTRAVSLRSAIRSARITKYNLGGSVWSRPANASRTILVAGQVEGDASLSYGGGSFRTNAELLRTVREMEPDAYIVYKPHPDVVAGLRRGAVPPQLAQMLCDEVLSNVSTPELIKAIDEVHVMTSLIGFEALVLGKKVVTYGNPFYAGWGLTVDRASTVSRRGQVRSMEALIAAALICYPTYVSATTYRFTSPERVLTELAALREKPRRRPKVSPHGGQIGAHVRRLWNVLIVQITRARQRAINFCR